MKQPNQSGFGLIGILIAVAVVAVGVGAYATLSTPTHSITGSDDFVADPTKSGIENMAQNIAENTTGDMMDVVATHNSEVTAEMNSDAKMKAEAKTDPAVEVKEVIEATPPVATSAGTFEKYSEDKLALAENGTVVLFFHANWCPSCRGLENDINTKLSQIPANTHILKLDYDTETQLKKKYGVIRQHTLIEVDANGNVVKKLTGLTNTLNQVVAQL